MALNWLHFTSNSAYDAAGRSHVRGDKAVCDAEVASLLAKNSIVEVEDDSIKFVCSFFCIPKKAGGFRPIVNLKPVNHFIRYEHFQMESLETVRFLVREGDWFVKLDPSLSKNPTKGIWGRILNVSLSKFSYLT